MHSLDQAVRRHDDMLAGRRLPDSGVVADSELETAGGSRVWRKRRFEKLDQSELADIANSTLVGHPFASRRRTHVPAAVAGLVA
jgi:hypothetical protein